MAGTLRSLSAAAAKSLRSTPSVQLQQQRFAGDLPAHTNKHVESWATFREHVEDHFKWDRKTLITLAVWVGIVPYFFWKMSIADMAKADKKFGREPKKLAGA